MSLDFSLLVYDPVMLLFSRPVTITPVAGASYTARGIYDTVPTDIVAEDGSLISDARTILDIMEAEFGTLPQQRDVIDIPADGTVPAAGTFEVLGSDSNGGGLTTLTLRRVVTAAP